MNCGSSTPANAGATSISFMKLLQKKCATPHRPDRAPVIVFVTCIHPTKPVLLRRIGWKIADDLHDDLYDSISEDNGNTWSPPQPCLKRRAMSFSASLATASEATKTMTGFARANTNTACRSPSPDISQVLGRSDSALSFTPHFSGVIGVARRDRTASAVFLTVSKPLKRFAVSGSC
jgi:hypothetical protein